MPLSVFLRPSREQVWQTLFHASRAADARASREAVADVLARRQEREAARRLYPHSTFANENAPAVPSTPGRTTQQENA